MDAAFYGGDSDDGGEMVPGDMTENLKSDAAQEEKSRKSRAAARQAIVLIHGMGEQIPMDTIKSFVSTLWVTGVASVVEKATEIWSKPDPRTGSLELRRITTRKSKTGGEFPNGVRNDFYELYWADLTAGSTTNQLVGWVKYLLFRPLSRVPPPVRSAWFLLWFLSLLALAIGSLSFVPATWWLAIAPTWLPQTTAIAAAAALGAVLQRMGTATFGRVVKYTRSEPDNIAARAAVRERGLSLLRHLHTGDDYDRIIVVGHSLGSILAYDLVAYFWAEQEVARSIAEGTPAFQSLCRLEESARRLKSAADVTAIKTARTGFRLRQAELRRAMSATERSGGETGWHISDLVTFGSPLTHSEFLLAASKEDLKGRQTARELPTAPPLAEALEKWRIPHARSVGLLPTDSSDDCLMAFPERKKPGFWTLHHGAPFSVVRWTNIHDPSSLIYRGDLISGPLSSAFGSAIEDIDLRQIDRPATTFSHTLYWDSNQSEVRITAFRRAINLLDEDLDWAAEKAKLAALGNLPTGE